MNPPGRPPLLGHRPHFVGLMALIMALLLLPTPTQAELPPDHQEWLEREGPLRIAVHGTSPGLSEPGPNGMQGAFIDLLQLAALHLGIEIEIIEVPDLESALAASARGDAHLAGPVVAARVEAEGGAASLPFFKTTGVLVANTTQRDIVRVEDLDGRVVGLLLGSPSQGVLQERAPGADVVHVDSLEAAVLDLRAGHLDAVMGNNAPIGAAILKHGIHNQTFVAEEMASFPIVAYAPVSDVPLHILNEGIREITPAEMRLITIKWTGFDLSIAPAAPGVPEWLYRLVWASTATAISLVGLVFISRWQVRRATRELAQLNESLEDRVRQRTQEAKAAQEVAEQASQARAAFLANMSHEIRTPLNAILGMVNILAEEDLGPNQDRVQIIRSSGKHLLGVINDILDLTKIDAGQMELDERPTVVLRVVEEACDVVANAAAHKELRLINDFREVPAAVTADAGRLRQVLVNLLSNAVKFTVAGEVRITTSTQGDQLVFQVRDTGPGIPQADQETIWDAFQQGDMTTTRQQAGTGLGLTITRHLVRLMDGTIDMDSRPTGTTFTVRLPCRPTTPHEELSWMQPTRSLEGCVVLMVDDDPVNLDVLARQVAQWSVQSVTTTDPEEALSLARHTDLDAAILDLHMPGTDGIALAKAIREIRPDLPLLMLASGDVPVSARQLFVGHLTKPARASDLYDHLMKIGGSDHHEAQSAFDPDLAGRVPCRILVAEDNPFNQVVAVDLLRRFGYEPAVAQDGVQAIQMAPDFDVIFMDIQMPVVDGLSATRTIRESGQDVRIIGLSAHVGPAERRAGEDAGMDDYLAKPIDVARLRAMLEDCRSP